MKKLKNWNLYNENKSDDYDKFSDDFDNFTDKYQRTDKLTVISNIDGSTLYDDFVPKISNEQRQFIQNVIESNTTKGKFDKELSKTTDSELWKMMLDGLYREFNKLSKLQMIPKFEKKITKY